MSNHSPIPSPSPSLIARWWDEAKQNAKYDEPIGPLVATQAAQWGADQELEACCEWLFENDYDVAPVCLRATRRPKPPSLKELALEALEHILHNSSTELGAATIRRAIEQLPD